MSEKIEYYIQTVDKAVNDAEKYQSKIDIAILQLPGMSGQKTRHFLNNLVGNIDGRYLEVGVYAGSTFCSALNKTQKNNYNVAIDNWSEFGGPKYEFLNNVSSYVDLQNIKVSFVEKDCFQVTEKDLHLEKFGKFPIYLYDGPHKFNDHVKALTHYINFLENEFIYLCDDWNWTEDVELGTRKAFEQLNLTIHKEWIMKTPNNIDHDHKGWWNGYYAAVISKELNNV